MLAITLACLLLAAVSVVCLHAPPREPRRQGLGLGVPAAQAAAPRVAVRYRGVTAEGWAARYRAMWRRARDARRALRAAVAQPRYTSSIEAAFLCIHRFEGSWTDSGAPHWGGLQMDLDFQRTYGDWALAAFGTADRWPVSVQLAVAIRAKVSGRGFYPWPNTARYCGLI